MSHQNGILHSLWLTSRNAATSIGSVYKDNKVPTLFAPFLLCDVIADKAYTSRKENYIEVTTATDAPILKKKIIIYYGYSIARVQRTTIASSTIGGVNNYNVKRTTIGGVNNYSVVYSGTGRCQ